MKKTASKTPSRPKPQSRPPAQSNSGFARLLAQPGLICLLLAGVTFAVFWPVVRYDFINCDDPEYITANPQVQDGLTLAGVRWAFRTGYFGNWLPLTWLSHMLDVQLFGAGAAGPHFINVLLHAANTVLVFLILRRLTGAHWRSALVAELFALHPLHVESVAWAAERRDVLSSCFGLLALLAYARYAIASTNVSPRPANSKSPFHWWLALFWFLLSLMSKPMLVTLPLVMLLLDYWPLRRFEVATFPRLLGEKIPFFVLSAVFCALTPLLQRRAGALSPLGLLPLTPRIQNAFVSYARYLGKTFWPAALAFPYPHPGRWPWVLVTLSAALVAALCFGALWLGRRRPYLFTGWFWFFGMLLPVIGLIQVGPQAMADRFTYLPLIGLFIIAVWGAGEALAQVRLPRIAIGLAASLALAACAARTEDQLRYWRNSEILFRHAIAVVPNNYLAQNNLGAYLAGQGRLDEAIADYRLSLQTKPDHVQTLNNLGSALMRQQRYPEARECFDTALRLQPGDVEVLDNLGTLLARMGRIDDAIAQYRQVLQQDPESTDTYGNLGNALAMKGELGEATVQYRNALRYNPRDAGAHNNLGYVLALQHQFDEAVAQCSAAVRLAPDDAKAQDHLGYALAGQGQLAAALPHYQTALQLQPDDPQTHFHLGEALARLGRREEAAAQWREALRLKPDYAEAKQSLQILGCPTP